MVGSVGSKTGWLHPSGRLLLERMTVEDGIHPDVRIDFTVSLLLETANDYCCRTLNPMLSIKFLIESSLICSGSNSITACRSG